MTENSNMKRTSASRHRPRSLWWHNDPSVMELKALICGKLPYEISVVVAEFVNNKPTRFDLFQNMLSMGCDKNVLQEVFRNIWNNGDTEKEEMKRIAFDFDAQNSESWPKNPRKPATSTQMMDTLFELDNLLYNYPLVRAKKYDPVKLVFGCPKNMSPGSNELINHPQCAPHFDCCQTMECVYAHLGELGNTSLLLDVTVYCGFKIKTQDECKSAEMMQVKKGSTPIKKLSLIYRAEKSVALSDDMQLRKVIDGLRAFVKPRGKKSIFVHYIENYSLESNSNELISTSKTCSSQVDSFVDICNYADIDPTCMRTPLAENAFKDFCFEVMKHGPSPISAFLSVSKFGSLVKSIPNGGNVQSINGFLDGLAATSSSGLVVFDPFLMYDFALSYSSPSSAPYHRVSASSCTSVSCPESSCKMDLELFRLEEVRLKVSCSRSSLFYEGLRESALRKLEIEDDNIQRVLGFELAQIREIHRRLLKELMDIVCHTNRKILTSVREGEKCGDVLKLTLGKRLFQGPCTTCALSVEFSSGPPEGCRRKSIPLRREGPIK